MIDSKNDDIANGIMRLVWNDWVVSRRISDARDTIRKEFILKLEETLGAYLRETVSWERVEFEVKRPPDGFSLEAKFFRTPRSESPDSPSRVGLGALTAAISDDDGPFSVDLASSMPLKTLPGKDLGGQRSMIAAEIGNGKLGRLTPTDIQNPRNKNALAASHYAGKTCSDSDSVEDSIRDLVDRCVERLGDYSAAFKVFNDYLSAIELSERSQSFAEDASGSELGGM